MGPPIFWATNFCANLSASLLCNLENESW